MTEVYRVARYAILAAVGLLLVAAGSARAADTKNHTATAAQPADDAAPAGADRLREYIAAGEVNFANFVQSVYSESGELVRKSSGRVTLAPPNRFRWVYTDPFPQLIVSNGDELFIYDEDLEQVTIYDSGSALRSSPIMLFRDPESLERSFEITSLESGDGYDWVELRPRAEDADFDAVYVALDPIGLRVLEMRDKLGRATQIRINQLEVSRSVADGVFEFEIPRGIDVIRP